MCGKPCTCIRSNDLISRTRLADLDALAQKRLNVSAEGYGYRRAELQVHVYTAANNPVALLGLYRSIPRRLPDGHESIVSSELRKAYLRLVIKNGWDTPEHINAMADIYKDGILPSHDEAYFWAKSPHARPLPHMVEALFELERISSLIDRFLNEPMALDAVLTQVAGINHGEVGEQYKARLKWHLSKYAPTQAQQAFRRCEGLFAQVK